MAADVAEAEGSQQGIHQGMDQHIGVAVTIEAQAPWMVEDLTAKDQGPAWHQAVDVVAIANPQLHQVIAWDSPVWRSERRF
jgi:hypothetical protein